MEGQALPADHALDEPLGRDQRHLLRRHARLKQRWTGVVCHHHVELARRNVCPWNERRKVRSAARPGPPELWGTYLRRLAGRGAQMKLHPW